MEKFAEVYRRHGNIKNAANELGISWSALYIKLKKSGERIFSDKLKYGSDRDKLGAMAEIKFSELVPDAENANFSGYQSKVDFSINGWLVDVKASMPKKRQKKFDALTWAFSFKKQTFVCDFFCCFCLDEEKEIEKILLVPREFFEGLQTCTVSREGRSKWADYSIEPEELSEFFSNLGEKQ